MCQIMVSGTFAWPEEVQNGLGWLQRYYFPIFLVDVLSVGSARLCIMCAGIIAGQKSTEGYITLYLITGIAFYYFDTYIAAAFSIL